MVKRDGSEVRFRIRLLDIVVLLFVFLCIVGAMVRAGKLGIFREKAILEEYQIRFSVSNISASSVEAFIEGDTFTLLPYHQALGRLSRVESVTPAVVYTENGKREIVRTQYPEGTRVDLIGVISAQGTVGESGFLLGGILSVSPGIEYQVQSEHMDLVLKIIDVEKN